MSRINVCATLGGNMGTPPCDVRMGRIKYLLLTTSKEFTAAQIADSEAFEDALQTALLLPSSDNNKVYAFPAMRDDTDNTGDPNTGTLADGYEEVLNEALPKYLLRSTPGVCIQQQMASFNSWPGKIYVIDEANILWYRDNGSKGAKAWTCGYLYTNPPKWKGSGDVQTANTRVTFGEITEFKSGVGALKLSFAISDLTNLKDIVLSDLETENSSGALNNVFIIGGNVKCEGTNAYDSYSAGLAQAAAWKAYKGSDGSAIAITSVTANSTLSGWNITLNSAAFAALAAGTVIYIDLQSPTVLKALPTPVTGIEGNKVRFVKFHDGY